MDDAPQAAQLGQAVDLAASARSCGALQRRRQVRSGAAAPGSGRSLPSGLTGGCWGACRGARSAWAAAPGWAAMAEVALRNRRRARTDGLGMIAAAILAERSLEAGTDAGAPRLVAVDTTTGVPPGDTAELMN